MRLSDERRLTAAVMSVDGSGRGRWQEGEKKKEKMGERKKGEENEKCHLE